MNVFDKAGNVTIVAHDKQICTDVSRPQVEVLDVEAPKAGAGPQPNNNPPPPPPPPATPPPMPPMSNINISEVAKPAPAKPAAPPPMTEISDLDVLPEPPKK
jgi:hypothetical protein